MRGTGQSENKLSDSMTFSDHLEAVSYTHLRAHET